MHFSLSLGQQPALMATLCLASAAYTLRISSAPTAALPSRQGLSLPDIVEVPPPYKSLTGFDAVRQIVIYEADLTGRKLGFHLLEVNDITSSGSTRSKVVVQQVRRYVKVPFSGNIICICYLYRLMHSQLRRA